MKNLVEMVDDQGSNYLIYLETGRSLDINILNTKIEEFLIWNCDLT